jgi:uroporphyrinogen-III synthase
LDADVVSVDAYTTMPCHWDDLDGLLRRLNPQWVVFTSPRGYQAFASNLHHRTIGDSYRVAVIGDTTRDAVTASGGRVDFVPPMPSVSELLRELRNL